MNICSIYQDRPSPCKAYNCFERANLLKQKPAPDRWKKLQMQFYMYMVLKLKEEVPDLNTFMKNQITAAGVVFLAKDTGRCMLQLREGNKRFNHTGVLGRHNGKGRDAF